MPFHDLDQLRQAATGRWTEILVSAGLPAEKLDGRNHPCPKCGGSDRFAAFGDLEQRGAVHCRHCFTRGSAIAPSDGIATLRWWLNLSFGDALNALADSLGIYPTSIRRIHNGPTHRSSPITSPPSPDLSQQAIDGHTNFSHEAYQRMSRGTRLRLARRLLVSAAALTALRVGLTSDKKCSTWPMRNHDHDIIGVRVVALPWSDSGNAKWSRRGSQHGLFIPRETSKARNHLYVTEGASDTAAAISLGLWTIGRSSCNTSSFFVSQYLQKHQPKNVTLIADNDQPGRKGAERLSRVLNDNLPPSLSKIDVVVPPHESMDLRDWIAAGANHIDIEHAQPIAPSTPARQTRFHFG